METDDLDALMGGGDPASTSTGASTAATAPSAASGSTQMKSEPAVTGAQTLSNTAAAAAAADDEEDEDEDEDDDDTGVNLVFDAPSGQVGGRPGAGAFGTPVHIKPSRFGPKVWGTPNSAAPGSAAGAAPAAAVTNASTANAVVQAVQFPTGGAAGAAAGQAASAAGGAVAAASAGATGVGAAAAAANRPFRLPMPNDNIFESGQYIDQRIDRPWTLPGADISDWFNYGFDEETWKLYCQKQIQQRINAKMQVKLNVYEGDTPLQQPQRQQNMNRPMGMGMNMNNPNMNRPMQAGGMPMPPMPQQQQMNRPFQNNFNQSIATYDDDASVQLGGGNRRF